MRALFGHGEHPDSEAIVAAYLGEHIRAGMTGRQLERLTAAAIAAALGRPFPAYEAAGRVRRPGRSSGLPSSGRRPAASRPRPRSRR